MGLFQSKQAKQDKLMYQIQDDINRMSELIQSSNSNVVILRKDQTDDTLISNLTVITSNQVIGNNWTYPVCIIDGINLMISLGYKLIDAHVNMKDNFGTTIQKEYLFVRQ